MAIVVSSNISSLNTMRHLERSQVVLERAMARLSSGLRVNSAADDAAGLAISEKLRSQVRGFAQARRNAANAVSVTQTADGALAEINGILARMKELSVQAADGALTTSDRLAIHTEFTQIKTELDRIAASVEFNDAKLLDGTQAAGMTFQVGNDNSANDKITVSIADSRSAALGLSGATLSTVGGAQTALGTIDTAISRVTDRRAKLGAAENRLSVTMNTLATVVENLSAADSRIRDADVAAEAATFARSQILVQAGVSVLAQANQLPALALSLLGR